MTIKSFVYLSKAMAIELLRSDVMMVIVLVLVVMDVMISEKLNNHGSDMMEMEHRKTHEHIEIRPLAGILTMTQPGGTLSTILNCGL